MLKGGEGSKAKVLFKRSPWPQKHPITGITALMCIILKGDMLLTSSLCKPRCDELTTGMQLIGFCWQLLTVSVGEMC